ncbi:response regulator [Desulfonatronum parangueonense]
MASKSILIVEDESKFRFSICLVLRQQGYSVYEAGHGIEAMAILNELSESNHNVDLVITDIRMPRMSGIELMEALTGKSIMSQIPKIIVMTGYDHNEYASKLRAMGCWKIINKPFDADELLREVASALSAETIPGSLP